MTTRAQLSETAWRARKAAGLSQLQVANLGELNQSQVCDFENGRTLSLDKVLRLFAALNLDLVPTEREDA
jgi:transcriptional regulator with XRE-family HTH domain